MNLGSLYAKQRQFSMPDVNALEKTASPPDQYGFGALANIPLRYMQGVAMREKSDAESDKELRGEADSVLRQMVELSRTDYHAANGLKDAFVASGNPYAKNVAGWNFTAPTGKDNILKVAGDNGLYLIDENKIKEAAGDPKKVKKAVVGFFPSGKPAKEEKPFVGTRYSSDGSKITGKFATEDEAKTFSSPPESNTGFSWKNIFGGAQGKPPVSPPVTTPPASSTSSPPVKLLKEGIVTTFKNGQSWKLQDGKPVRVK